MSGFESIENPGNCDHCGRDLRSVSYGRTANGERLCHPMRPDGPDCYRLVTVYLEPVGKLLRPDVKKAGGHWSLIATELAQQVAELEEKLAEMTACRDSALRQLNREDVTVPLELEELILQGIDAVISDWEGDVPLSRVVESITKALHPSVVELVEYQERAEAKIRELAREVALLSGQVTTLRAHQHALETERDRAKERLDAVCNEVFTITDAYSLPEDRDEVGNAHLYGLGRLAALKDAYFAVLRGLGVFEHNHTVHMELASLTALVDTLEDRLKAIEALTEHAQDTKLLRLAINDPGAFTQRQKINEEEVESLANWAARAIQIALREGRGDR